MPAPWANGAQVRINGEIHGQQTVTVLHFATNTQELDISPPSPLLTALVEAVLDCILQTLLPAVTQDWRVISVDARYLHNVGAGVLTDPVIATAPANSVGTRGVTSVSFASSLVNLRTGVVGRRGRGKMFLPPAGEADITSSDLANDVLVLLAAFGTCMAGKFLGTSPSTVWRWGVYSRAIGGNGPYNFDTGLHLISQISPSAKVAVIARRKAGRGD